MPESFASLVLCKAIVFFPISNAESFLSRHGSGKILSNMDALTLPLSQVEIDLQLHRFVHTNDTFDHSASFDILYSSFYQLQFSVLYV